jgi:hypothetical protein
MTMRVAEDCRIRARGNRAGRGQRLGHHHWPPSNQSPSPKPTIPMHLVAPATALGALASSPKAVGSDLARRSASSCTIRQRSGSRPRRGSAPLERHDAGPASRKRSDRAGNSVTPATRAAEQDKRLRPASRTAHVGRSVPSQKLLWPISSTGAAVLIVCATSTSG